MPAFVEPSWVKNAKQTIGTGVEPVYPMKTVHGGNQVPDTEADPIGYRYDNGRSQYQYLDLAGTPTNLVNRGNLGETIKTLAPIALSMIGANFLAPALNDLFGPTASDLMGGGGSEFGAGAGDFPANQIQGFGFGAPDTSLLSNPYAGVFDAAGNVVSNAGDVLSAADIAAMGGADIAGLSGTAASNLAASVAGGMPALEAAAAAAGAGLTTGAGTQGLKATLNTSALPGAELAAGGLTGLKAIANTSADPGAVLTLGGGPGASLRIGDNLVTGSDILNLANKNLVSSNVVTNALGAIPTNALGTLTTSNLAALSTDYLKTLNTSFISALNTSNVSALTTDTLKPLVTSNVAALTTSNTSLLKQLSDLTGLTGTQLATFLTGLTGAGNAVNLTNAINTGLDATTAANTASQGVLKSIYDQQLGFQKPYQLTGTNALSQLGALGTGQYQQYDPTTGLPTTMGTGSGYLQHQFDASDLAKGLAPNYDFMLQQGQMANQRAANVGGGALSGNTLQGLNKYTQDYAGNAYQNAFNNYQTQRQNIYGNLSGLAGMGQTANTGAATAGTSYGKGTTDLQTALANAQAAAAIGKAQAVAGGTTGLANSTFLASLLAPPK